MSKCGCEGGDTPSERNRQRSCMVMCAVCLERRDGVCTVKNMTTTHIIQARIDCPMHHHPDQLGVLAWLGVKWYGVPMPVRLMWPALRRLHGWKPLSGPLPWCGCVKRLKDWWNVRA